MLSDRDQLAYLFHRYSEDLATPEEVEELFAYIRQAVHDVSLKAEIMALYENSQSAKSYEQVQWDAMFDSIVNSPAILEGRAKKRIVRMSALPRVAAAAVLILVLAGGGVYWLQQHRSVRRQTLAVKEVKDVAPGGNKAILTLGNGSKIILDNVQNGTVAEQGNAKVIKTDSGRLAYNVATTPNDRPETQNPEPATFNTLSTPRGGQYQLILPDGTKVWLNAASSITYPTAFTGRDRAVAITGEAYFEVTRDKSRPFKIRLPSSGGTGGGEIQVLGTGFNVNAYPDESGIQTTLLEGSIKLSAKDRSPLLIKPGQQAQLEGTRLFVVDGVNTDEVIAWKGGVFDFENAGLKTILRQFSRWYDVDVIYEGPVKNRKFFAVVKRSSTLKSVLELLQDNNIVYRIEGKKLFVKSD